MPPARWANVVGTTPSKKQSALPCEVVKKYPGQQQVDLSVVVSIPGKWFNDMSPEERAKSFSATAVEYATVRQFGRGNACARTEGIRFQVRVCV